MVNPSRFASDSRIDKPWGSTLREKRPRSVRLRYVNWCSKECQQSCRYADWISNIVPIEKKDSEKIRVCIDFRDLNKATPNDEYPMPIADMSKLPDIVLLAFLMVTLVTIKYLWPKKMRLKRPLGILDLSSCLSELL